MQYPAHLLSDNEKVITAFRPHWRSLIIPIIWTAVALAATVLAIRLPPDGGLPDLITYAIILVGWLVVAFAPVVRWWYTIHVLTNERLIVRAGIIARRGLEIPLEVINDVTFNQSIFERLLGYGDLLVESAGERGQSRLVDIPDPEHFQSLVYKSRETRAKELSGAASQSADALTKLAELHRQGVLTDEEFADKKRKLLDGM